jgi:DME family drug/metabolite transporter
MDDHRRMHSNDVRRGAGRSAVVLAATLFGTAAVASRVTAHGPAPMTAAAWRIVVGGSVLLVVTVIRGQQPWRYPIRWRPMLLGGAAVVAFQAGYFASVDRLGVASATMITIGAGPVAAGCIEWRRAGAAPSRRWCAGVALALVGIAALAGGGPVAVDPTAWLIALATGACFPAYGAATRELGTDRTPLAAIATVFGAAVPPALVMAIFVGGSPVASPGTVAVVLYLGLVTTAAAYVLWTIGLSRLALSDTVTITMLEPIAALVLSAAVLHERILPIQFAGVAAVLLGIVSATRPERRRPLCRDLAGGDIIDVLHRLAGGDHGEDQDDRADGDDDALVPQAVADLVGRVRRVDVAEGPLEEVAEQGLRDPQPLPARHE